ncbi:hypothetical protein [Streptomyces sp. KLOTTS4A1]|uniref:hypothetical protein n=1 Tax=Streptomyces sp. KLOTTS4A1 TaxID=3390996 RepID=UPI0039F4A61F
MTEVTTGAANPHEDTPAADPAEPQAGTSTADPADPADPAGPPGDTPAADPHDDSPATVRLRPLTLVDEGEDEVLVGDPATGEFITIPKVGGVVIEALRRGATTDEAAAEAEEFAGEPVDVPSFVDTLRELGFLDEGQESAPVRSAPVQGSRWLTGVRQERVRPFFGRVAWSLYTACAVFALAVFVLWPALFPDPATDAFIVDDIGLGSLILIPLALVAAAIHELGHWLAARALDLPARFGMDRRMVFLLVFETDLTQVWTVERRKRYGPLLAGLALDAVLLAVPLAGRLLIETGVWSAPGLLDAALATWIYVKLTGMLWQCMIFLRTDLYAVVVNALGCRNLWHVSSLMLRRSVGRLSPDGAAELADAHPADVRAGRWFRWVRLLGAALTLAWAGFFLAPFAWEMARWAADGLGDGPATGSFWWALLCTAVYLTPFVLPAALSVREHARRITARA